VVKFCEFFCTYSPSSLGQDPTVKSVKKFFFFMWPSLQFWGVLAKKGHGPLGSNFFSRNIATGNFNSKILCSNLATFCLKN
jgi:hypothetical protein